MSYLPTKVIGRPRAKDFFKRLFYPGFNFGGRSRKPLAKLFLTEKDASTLDVGCGNGHFTFLAARAGGNVLAISFDADAIARCEVMKRSFPELGARVDFQVMDAAQLESLSKCFDQILLLEVLEHIDNDAETLRMIAKLLSPGGVLHITTPDVRLGKWVGVLDRFAQGGHCRLGYSAERLEHLLRSSELDIAYAGRLGYWGDYLDGLRSATSRRLGGSLFAEGIVFLVIYPIYLLLKLIPIGEEHKIFQHFIARKPGRQ